LDKNSNHPVPIHRTTDELALQYEKHPEEKHETTNLEDTNRGSMASKEGTGILKL
jgi:hypothetical protein